MATMCGRPGASPVFLVSGVSVGRTTSAGGYQRECLGTVARGRGCFGVSQRRGSTRPPAAPIFTGWLVRAPSPSGAAMADEQRAATPCSLDRAVPEPVAYRLL